MSDPAFELATPQHGGKDGRSRGDGRRVPAATSGSAMSTAHLHMNDRSLLGHLPSVTSGTQE